MTQPSPDKDISTLVRLAKRGDGNARDQLVMLTRIRLYRFCLFLCANAPKAEDLFQCTYLKAFEKLKHLKDDNAFEPWLLTIARSLFLDEQKSRGENQERLDDHDDIQSTSPRPELKDLIIKIMNSLSETDRTVLLLVAMEEYSCKEAASILGINENAVNARLRRAKERFIEQLREQEVEITGVFEIAKLRKKDEDAA